jgi:hypothetical protein
MIRHQRTILSEVEASQGIKLGLMRYVLGISLAPSVVAGLALWSFYSGCIQHCYDLGCNVYITKPFDYEKILQYDPPAWVVCVRHAGSRGHLMSARHTHRNVA